ncbi:MAG: hypothetical protein Q8K01_07725 [Sulfurimicrobium sp.]|nr:hypothetical protein [Sulfurimicrobium sp.]
MLALISSPACVGQVVAVSGINCLPVPGNQTEEAIYSRFGITGAELHLLGRELANGGRATAETLLRYKLGDNAARYALFAKAAYGKSPTIDWDGKEPAEWQLVTSNSKEYGDSGLVISVYKRTAQGAILTDSTEVIIAIRGTEPTDFRDLMFDGVAALGYVDLQLKQAYQFVTDFFAKNPTKANRTVLVGHSLGGRIAQIIAANKGLRAFTFNAAAVRKEVAQAYGLTVYPLLPGLEYSLITSVVSSADWVNPSSKVFILAEDLGQRLQFNFCGPGQGHGIDGVVVSLERVQKIYRERLNPSPKPSASLSQATVPSSGPTSSVPSKSSTPTAPITNVVNSTPSSVSDAGNAVLAKLGNSSGTMRFDILNALMSHSRVASGLTAADLNAIIVGMEDQRARVVSLMARMLQANLGATEVVALSGQTSGRMRFDILNALMSHSRVASGLTAADLNAIIVGMEDQRARVVSLMARLLQANP